MIIENIERFICEYSYDGDEDTFFMESSSAKYLKHKISEFVDCGKGISYKIYAVIEEGYKDAIYED